jgi:hypothetical protein
VLRLRRLRRILLSAKNVSKRQKRKMKGSINILLMLLQKIEKSILHLSRLKGNMRRMKKPLKRPLRKPESKRRKRSARKSSPRERLRKRPTVSKWN